VFETIVVYAVGTLAGFFLSRQYFREQMVTQTLDTLIAEDYVRSWEDEDGQVHLYKWYELEDLLEDANVVVKVDDEIVDEGKWNEKDDAS
jgi:hypothetical protein